MKWIKLYESYVNELYIGECINDFNILFAPFGLFLTNNKGFKKPNEDAIIDYTVFTLELPLNFSWIDEKGGGNVFHALFNKLFKTSISSTYCDMSGGSKLAKGIEFKFGKYDTFSDTNQRTESNTGLSTLTYVYKLSFDKHKDNVLSIIVKCFGLMLNDLYETVTHIDLHPSGKYEPVNRTTSSGVVGSVKVNLSRHILLTDSNFRI